MHSLISDDTPGTMTRILSTELKKLDRYKGDITSGILCWLFDMRYGNKYESHKTFWFPFVYFFCRYFFHHFFLRVGKCRHDSVTNTLIGEGRGTCRTTMAKTAIRNIERFFFDVMKPSRYMRAYFPLRC